MKLPLYGLMFLYLLMANPSIAADYSLDARTPVTSPLYNEQFNLRKEYLSQITDFKNGPNCWNGALYLLGQYPLVLHTSQIHAKYLFENNCQRVSPENSPGPTLVRYMQNREDIHAAVQLDKKSYFQKRGNSATDPYEVTSIEQIEDNYGKNKEFRKCRTNSPTVKEYSTLPKSLQKIFITLSKYSISNKSPDILLTATDFSDAEHALTKIISQGPAARSFYYLFLDLAWTSRLTNFPHGAQVHHLALRAIRALMQSNVTQAEYSDSIQMLMTSGQRPPVETDEFIKDFARSKLSPIAKTSLDILFSSGEKLNINEIVGLLETAEQLDQKILLKSVGFLLLKNNLVQKNSQDLISTYLQVAQQQSDPHIQRDIRELLEQIQ